MAHSDHDRLWVVLVTFEIDQRVPNVNSVGDRLTALGELSHRSHSTQISGYVGRYRLEQEHHDQKALSFISSSHILRTFSFFLAGVDGFFLCFIIYLPLSLSLFDDDFHGIEADVIEVREEGE